MAISYANNDWLQTLNAVNAASPVPNYNATNTTKAGGSGQLFGIDPKQITDTFDSSFSKAEGKYEPFPGDHSKIDQLQDVYNHSGEAFDVSGTLSALGDTRKANLLGGEQAANTAAHKFQETSAPGGQSGAGASMLRAQALLPFLQADTAAAGEQGKYADSAKQGALSAAANIANNLAQLQQQYTDSLASYNSNKANFGLNYAGAQSDLALKSSQSNIGNQLELYKTNAQIAENARQANLQAALHTQDSNLQANQTATSQRTAAASAYLQTAKAPTGAWTTGNNGQVISGQSDYDAYQAYLRNRGGVANTLARTAY